MGITRLIAFLLVGSLSLPPSFAQEPTPSPTLSESGDVEGQRKTLEQSRSLASKAQSSAETSRGLFAAAAGVCWLGCAWAAATAACLPAGVIATVYDVAAVASSKKRYKNALDTISTTLALAENVSAGVQVASGSTASYAQSSACYVAGLYTLIAIVKEFPIESFRKSQRRAERELSALGGDASTRMDLTVPDVGDGRLNAVEGSVPRTGIGAPSSRGGGKGSTGVQNAATACSAFALNRDVSGAAACLTREGEKIPGNVGSPEFAKLFEKASGADLGQFLKNSASDGATAEGLLKKATANIPGMDSKKLAALMEIGRSELGSTYRGGGSGQARRTAGYSDEDKTAVLRTDSAESMKFADPAPLDTSLFGRATSQYLKFTKKKYFETP